MEKEVDQARLYTDKLDSDKIEEFEGRFDKIIAEERASCARCDSGCA
jgi:hypothetical protein